MKKQKRIWTSVGALGLALFLWWTQNESNVPEAQNKEPQHEDSRASIQSLANDLPESPTAAAQAPSVNSAKSVQESLADMSETLFQFTKSEGRLRDLVAHLKQTGQDPLVTHNSNPHSGEMAIVRTQSPLPGTRYFHAQYFTDASGLGFVQHMSFEYKPSPTAMSEAIAAVRRSFSLPEPETLREDYARWSLEDGHIIWVKKMEAQDLKDDPFNAYSDQDIGTVRVAVEVEIH